MARAFRGHDECSIRRASPRRSPSGLSCHTGFHPTHCVRRSGLHRRRCPSPSGPVPEVSRIDVSAIHAGPCRPTTQRSSVNVVRRVRMRCVSYNRASAEKSDVFENPRNHAGFRAKLTLAHTKCAVSAFRGQLCIVVSKCANQRAATKKSSKAFALIHLYGRRIRFIDRECHRALRSSRDARKTMSKQT